MRTRTVLGILVWGLRSVLRAFAVCGCSECSENKWFGKGRMILISGLVGRRWVNSLVTKQDQFTEIPPTAVELLKSQKKRKKNIGRKSRYRDQILPLSEWFLDSSAVMDKCKKVISHRGRSTLFSTIGSTVWWGELSWAVGCLCSLLFPNENEH